MIRLIIHVMITMKMMILLLIVSSIYSLLHERGHQQEENESDRLKPLSMDEAIEELTYSLLQGGGSIRKQAAYHPPLQRDLQYVFDRNG